MHGDKVSSGIRSCPTGIQVPPNLVFPSMEWQSGLRVNGALTWYTLTAIKLRTQADTSGV